MMPLSVALRMKVHFVRHIVNNIYEIGGEVQMGDGREDLLLEAAL